MFDLLPAIAAEYPTPCFVYDMDAVRARIALLRTAFGGRFTISYAVKCNPNPTLLSRLRDAMDCLDASSVGELRRVLAAGWSADRVTFTGPAKRDVELAAAVETGAAVVIESVAEAARLNSLAPSASAKHPILIRVAPARIPAGFGSRMAGKPSQFGIDEEDLSAAIPAVLRLDRLRLIGLHVYAGTQCLSASAIAQYYHLCCELFRRTCREHTLAPEKLIFGSGLGIPYHDGDRPIDLSAVAEASIPVLDALRGEALFADTQFMLETGRYLVGEAGVFLTRVVSIKRSRGAIFAICDGGMNQHLGAAGLLGSVLRRNYRMFKVGATSDEPRELYTLCGPLCTTIDTLAQNIELPRLAVGDVVGVHCSGAYGPTASPVHFISHPPPREILVETVAGRRCIIDITAILAADP